MKILFATDELRNECNNQELLIKRYGAHRARLVRQRLDEMFNAEVLADMRAMPHLTFLDAEGSSAFELDVGNPYRLAFRPSQPGDGERDWKKVDSIIILGLIKKR
jgi:hypothetical protein